MQHPLALLGPVFRAALLLALLAFPVRADVAFPPRPSEREFISDQAGIISPEDEAAIKAVADQLLTDAGVPIVVVTIDSLARYGAAGWPIERYATALFDAWGIGRRDRNYGILFLVSKGDRKARVEFGRGYSRGRDQRADRILSSLVIPRFRKGDFSGGIREGVKALEFMARNEGITGDARGGAAAGPGAEPPSAPAPQRSADPARSPPAGFPSGPDSPVGPASLLGPVLCVGLAAIGLLLLVGLARRRGDPSLGGAGGYQGVGGYSGAERQWNWGGSALPLWWYLLHSGGADGRRTMRDDAYAPPARGSDWTGGMSTGGGGGFDFGSFGGGSSGGGGATGSW